MRNDLMRYPESITLLKRVLYSNSHHKNGPTILVFGGVHGNEPAGINALKKVIQQIETNNIKFVGNFYAIAGNINALQKKVRYETTDLNRIWTKTQVEHLNKNPLKATSEEKEQLELYQTIKEIVTKHEGPFYFIDLHTTSSETEPFVTISDSLNNRAFTKNFSLPIILGIEEYLEGTLLTYINEFGYISLGFEAGQHDNPQSIENCEAFIWLALTASGCVQKNQIKKYQKYQDLLSLKSRKYKFYEIKYHHQITDKELFKMNRGFKNFDTIKKNQTIAVSNSKDIKANCNGYIFMPLYQNQGNDGYFIIAKISKFWLSLSVIVRQLKLYHILRLLPGIRQHRQNAYTLVMNPKVAKFLATQIFHLFGYRKKILKDDKMHLIRRDRKVIPFK